MPEARQLSRSGIEVFRGYVDSAASGADVEPPAEILFDENHSRGLELEEAIEVEEDAFRTKREAGKYFFGKIPDAAVQSVRRNTGFWSWLALFYFDILCPEDDSGSRSVKRAEHYILVQDWRRYYRHLLVTPWEIYRDYPDGAFALLSGSVGVHGDFVEQLASRQEIVSNPALVETVDQLYFDFSEGSTKWGATSRNRKGNIRRFVLVKQQLDKTFDLYSLEPDRVVELLPGEFEAWAGD